MRSSGVGEKIDMGLSKHSMRLPASSLLLYPFAYGGASGQLASITDVNTGDVTTSPARRQRGNPDSRRWPIWRAKSLLPPRARRGLRSQPLRAGIRRRAARAAVVWGDSLLAETHWLAGDCHCLAVLVSVAPVPTSVPGAAPPSFSLSPNQGSAPMANPLKGVTTMVTGPGVTGVAIEADRSTPSRRVHGDGAPGEIVEELVSVGMLLLPVSRVSPEEASDGVFWSWTGDCCYC